MNAMLLTLVTLLSTSAGGLCALRFGDRAHLMLGFSAGALLGVVSFDLLPEIFALSHAGGGDGAAAMGALVAGFVLFHIVETSVLVHVAHEADYATHRHPKVGQLSAAAMIGHSFIDGAGIGLAFQLSPTVGLTTALAVIAHDFCDGLNTVNLMLMHGNSRRRARSMLTLNAVAPLFGAASTLLVTVSAPTLVLLLGFFAGVLLYIATADIAPQAHSRAGPAAAVSAIAAMACGALCVAVVTGVTG